MATDLDEAETGLLLGAVLIVGYLVWKAAHVVGDTVHEAAQTVNQTVGPPVGTDPTTACNGGPCPDDILARQPWWQSTMKFLGIGQPDAPAATTQTYDTGVNDDSAGQGAGSSTLPEGSYAP